ncbi:copper chaperone [Andreprevotia lacus DSM 23236]|jgi:copper ion binding protein|uniref:Copper chaperone n=1 Tax=Andreprevotia lacus DSM 23236 TaxID=1121001 RepID=A0A1W1WZ10_9NEIS|nr:heavy-metal-associated domain-containing protein [Andreprevotia lacus]SMC16678.1 copper chaperone [Andreprevotia lacus DSM 23236]
METTTIQIGGMSCNGCVAKLTSVLGRLPGVQSADVSLDTGKAIVQFDPGRATVDAFRQAIADAGYELV